MEKSKAVYFEIMVEAIDSILAYSKDMDLEEFTSDRKTFDACLMQFQHLGETANKVRTHFPHERTIPFEDVIGFRNFIAHEYLGIDIGIVFDTIQEDLPKLRKSLLLENRH